MSNCTPRRPRGARLLLASAPLALVALVFATDAVRADEAPTALNGKDRVDAALSPPGDVDLFGLDLGVGDRVKVKVQDRGPRDGLRSNLVFRAPDGSSTGVFVSGQDGFRPSFDFTADEAGTHVLELSGNVEGDYRLKASIKRAKLGAEVFEDAAGGDISYSFYATAGSQVTLSAATRRGGLTITELRRPDGSAEPLFLDSLKAARNGRKAKTKKFAVSGGSGVYELRGTYESGSKVKVKAKVKHADRKRNRTLSDDEPDFDPLFPPTPGEGVAGTLVFVAGENLPFDPGEVDERGRNLSTDDDVNPVFTLDGVAVDPSTVTALGGSSYTFEVPAGLTPGERADLRVVIDDGRSAILEDAFRVVPGPAPVSLDPVTAGPAGGRTVTISGTDFHPTSLVLVDGLVVLPDLVNPTEIRFTVPARVDDGSSLPETVDVGVRDSFGQSATLTDALTYLDVPVPAIDSLTPDEWQALGGELVSIRGSGFAEDVVVTLDGAPIAATRNGPDEIALTSPLRADGTVRLRVEDGLGQSAETDVVSNGLRDGTAVVIPAPNQGEGVADGWNAQDLIATDVDDDGDQDLLLLRPSAASGASADRSRLRLLLGRGSGGFVDATATNLPGVTAADDWRGVAMALIDYDGDDDDDLAILTDEELDGGNRSSLRLLRNDDGTFVDVTATVFPEPTDYDDRNQGVALGVGDIDGQNGPDLVVLHDEFFTRVTVIPGDTTVEPPIDDVIIEDDFPGLRVFLSQADDTFVRDIEPTPAVDRDDLHQYQGDLLLVGNLTGGTRDDILITRDAALEDDGQFLRTAFLLENDGVGDFTDESASRLPAASDPEFLQADRVLFTDLGGGPDRDLLFVSSTRMIVRSTGQPSGTPSLRLFVNDGSGNYAAPGTSPFPEADGLDTLQASDVAVADLNGDLILDLFLVSTRAPNLDDRAGRVLLGNGDGSFTRASVALPNPLTNDDLRGRRALAVDIDGDGDDDLIFSRDEGRDTERGTRALFNPR